MSEKHVGTAGDLTRDVDIRGDRSNHWAIRPNPPPHPIRAHYYPNVHTILK